MFPAWKFYQTPVRTFTHTMPIYLFWMYDKVNKHYHEKYVTIRTGSSAQDVEPRGMIWRRGYHGDVIERWPKILVVGNYERSLNTYPWRFFHFLFSSSMVKWEDFLCYTLLLWLCFFIWGPKQWHSIMEWTLQNHIC